MNDDDDFGDLYAADVGGGAGVGTGTLYEVTKAVTSDEGRRRFGDGEDDEEKEDEEELLYGTSSSSAVVAAAPAAGVGVGLVTVGQAGFEVGGKEVENEETFLYGELYGSTPTTTTRSDDAARVLQSESAGRGAGIGNGNLYLMEVGGLPRSAGTSAAALSSLENPRVGLHQQVVAPGLAPSGSFSLRGKEEVAPTVRGNVVAEGAEEDWDSDSDDGLQIVLNDDAPAYDNTEGDGKGEFYEGSDDEDEEDLIIVAGDEPLDGQEDWGEEGGPLLEPPLPGPPCGGPPGAAERILPGEDEILSMSSIECF